MTSAKQQNKPFVEELEDMLSSDIAEGSGGYLHGSLSGESWKTFLSSIRKEAVERLKAYRDECYMPGGFRPSSMHPYCEERMKIEREYVRRLVSLYGNAGRAYKNLSG